MAIRELWRRLWSPVLDIREIEGREPADVDHWREPNILQRAIAHLAGRDGDRSRLLACDSSARLRVALSELLADTKVSLGAVDAYPFYALRSVSSRGQIVEGTSPSADLGEHAARIIGYQLHETGTDAMADFGDSMNGMSIQYRFPPATKAALRVWRGTWRYLYVDSAAGDAVLDYWTWDLE